MYLLFRDHQKHAYTLKEISLTFSKQLKEIPELKTAHPKDLKDLKISFNLSPPLNIYVQMKSIVRTLFILKINFLF